MSISKLEQLIEIAKNKGKKRLAVAAAEDKYVLNAIVQAEELGLIEPIYIGNEEQIIKLADELQLNINMDSIIDAPNVHKSCAIAVEMVANGKADFLMKGLVSTGDLLRQVLSKEYGLLSGKLLSHLAIFESPYYHKLIGVTDAAMNVHPDTAEKAGIVQNAVNAFSAIGIEKSKVAMLAAVEKVNLKMDATTDAAILSAMCQRGQLYNCIVDGPLALDNAVSKEAATHKGIKSEVAGDADILMAPDIQSGNVLYKTLGFLGGAKCAAVILGAKAPVVLTSRSDTEESKFLSIVLGVATA